jgi:hypothetical protein
MTPEEQDEAMVDLERRLGREEHARAVQELRRRCRTGEAARDDRQMEAARRARDAATLERIEAERKRLRLERAETMGPGDIEERARCYLERIEADGHASLLAVSCHAARGFALEVVTAVEVVTAWAGSRWPRAEVARTVKWAERHGKGEIGYLLARRARVR